MSETTILTRKDKTQAFLLFLTSRGIADVDAISVTDIDAFLLLYINNEIKYREAILCVLRSYLGYLYEKGYTPTNLKETLPHLRVPRSGGIPHAWKKEELTAILGAIDREAPAGKRDYAVLLLTIQSGLRAGDIRNLRLNDIEVKLIGIAGLKFTCFQLNYNVTTQIEIVEQQVNVEIVAAHVEVILIAEERKAGAQFQKELGYVLDESLFNISFDHIFLERNEIKDIRVFHRLHSQFALRSRKSIFKVADLIRNGFTDSSSFARLMTVFPCPIAYLTVCHAQPFSRSMQHTIRSERSTISWLFTRLLLY